MLSAWERPLEGREITKRLDDASLLVQTVHRSVVRNSSGPGHAAADGCGDEDLTPRGAGQSMVARTIRSHLRYKYDGH